MIWNYYNLKQQTNNMWIYKKTFYFHEVFNYDIMYNEKDYPSRNSQTQGHVLMEKLGLLN